MLVASASDAGMHGSWFRVVLMIYAAIGAAGGILISLILTLVSYHRRERYAPHALFAVPLVILVYVLFHLYFAR